MNRRLEITISDRFFKVWQFLVSHGQLLIRSPIAPETRNRPRQVTNVDLWFQGVDYLEVPTVFGGFELAEPTEEEIQRLESIVGKVGKPEWIRVFVSEGKRYLVVASGFQIYENDWGHLESSLDTQMTNRDRFEDLTS